MNLHVQFSELYSYVLIDFVRLLPTIINHEHMRSEKKT